MAALNCSPYLQLLSSWRENLSVSTVVLDGRRQGVALTSLTETPTGLMTMRGNSEAIEYWPRMATKIRYGTTLKYGRDADEYIMAQIEVYI
jgi:hypothetical protein